ncbi:uncharacterized protein LOC135473024 [Liolophura sinensis]|uniref:uncharacterized protein LOC135473024 n=1 Tax=Liolophura sinensis TaxID=3198878 RepID=UPI0031592DB2
MHKAGPYGSQPRQVPHQEADVLTVAMLGNFPLTSETIGLIRRGSDIDVEAIFGGNIAGRRLTGVKINPLFLEGQSEEDVRQAQSLGRNGYHTHDPTIRLNVYDLRSPAHRQNGKRQTIVKIGRNEILSVSTSSHATGEGEISVSAGTADNGPTPEAHIPVPENSMIGDSVQESRVSIQTEDSAAYVSVVTETAHVRKTPLTSPEAKDHSSPSQHSGRRATTCYDNPHTKDVREVVVSFSETADRPVMDKPSQEIDWSESGDVTDPRPPVHKDSPDGVLSQDGRVSLDGGVLQEGCVPADEPNSHTSSPEVKTLKPILVRSQSSFDSVLSSAGLSLALGEDTPVKYPPKTASTKTVKFAEDTIDNENKTKRYMKERIDLSKLMLESPAYGSVNPVFLEEEEEDDEEVNNVNNNQPELPRYDQLPDLNVPSYMQKYLVDAPPSKPVGVEGRPYSPSHTTVIPEQPDSEESPGDTSQDTEISEVPGYEAFVLKTAAQERRKQAIKWTLITVVVVAVLIVSIALPVYFTSKDS